MIIEPAKQYIYESNKNLDPSKMAVVTNSVMNRKLKIFVIESRTNTYNSSSYKISTITKLVLVLIQDCEVVGNSGNRSKELSLKEGF